MRPIYPQPGFVEQDLKDLLATKQFVYAVCYTITTKFGVVLYLTSAQENVKVTSVEDTPVLRTFTSKQILVGNIKVEMSIGVEVDEQEVLLSFEQDTLLFGMPVSQALKWGRLDGAIVKTDRYYAADWGQPWVAGIPIFRGRVSSVDRINRISAEMKVKSEPVVLDVQMPRKLYQPGCSHSFGDIGCGYDREAAAIDAETESGSNPTYLAWAGALDDQKFGTVLIEDDLGFALVRTIRSIDNGSGIRLAYPLDFDPGTGREFLVLPGCSRTYERCVELNNEDRYQGFPFVPVAETAY